MAVRKTPEQCLEASAELLCRKAYKLCRENKGGDSIKDLKEYVSVLKDIVAVSGCIGRESAGGVEVGFDKAAEEYSV